MDKSINKLNIQKSYLKGLIEDHIFNRLNEKYYLIEKVEPQKLLTANRLDIGFKLSYLDLKNANKILAEKIYFEDIKSQSLGSFIEPGNLKKNRFDNFKNSFQKILENLDKNGFDRDITIIPLSLCGSILNGAHRLSSALFLGISVWSIHTKLPKISCDYSYFYKRAMPIEFIEIGVSKWLEYSEDVYLAFLWPSGLQNWSKVEKLFPNIIYKKKLSLSFQGAFNLLYMCYKHMDWVGCIENKFHGIKQKRLECFPNSLDLKIILFQEKGGLKKVQQIKDKIREINGIGYSSIHITDSKKEVIELTNILLNENALNFINYSKNITKDHTKIFEKLTKFVLDNKLSLNDILIDGSFVLELYGFRESKDLDVIFSDTVDKKICKRWGDRDHQLQYHDKKKHDLIYNPRNFFYFNGFKIISLQNAILFKANRQEVKDVYDIKLFNAVSNKKNFQKIFVKILQNLEYLKLKLKKKSKEFLIKILKTLGLLSFVKIIWKKLKNDI